MKSNRKRLLTTFLVTTLTVTNISYFNVFAATDELVTESQEKKVLFETSFEDSETDKEFLETTIDTKKGSSNISSLPKQVVIDGSINNKIILSSVKSSTRLNDNEIAVNLFDDSTNTKFLGNNSNGINSENPVWVSLKLKKKYQ